MKPRYQQNKPTTLRLIATVRISGVREAEEILMKAGDEDLFEKGRPRKHQVGETHPLNPNLVWTDLGNGYYAWRSKKGRYFKGGKYNPKKDPAVKQMKKKVPYPLGAGTNGIRPLVKKKKK